MTTNDTYNFDFEYVDEEEKHYYVEVKYTYTAPDHTCKNSDWDYYGGYDIQEVKTFDGNKEVYNINITDDYIIKQIIEHIKDLEINWAIEENQYY